MKRITRRQFTGMLVAGVASTLPIAARTQGGGKVTLYMGPPEKTCTAITQGFEKKTGIKPTFLRLSAGEAVNRIRAEKPDAEEVEDAKKYNFDAKTLLSAFVDIYLNLAQKPAFIEAVAADGRSYKPGNFHEASRILTTKSLKSAEELARWGVLKEKVKEAKDIADKAELDLGDIPEEFEDQLMGILMTDPVILPSKNVVDRTTIVQQLLSNPLDPFTRQPMTIDDVVPDDSLRARVDEWKAERIAAARKSRDGDQMDTTEG